MALYVTRPRRDEERIGRGLPSGPRSDLVYGICRGLQSEVNRPGTANTQDQPCWTVKFVA